MWKNVDSGNGLGISRPAIDLNPDTFGGTRNYLHRAAQVYPRGNAHRQGCRFKTLKALWRYNYNYYK